MNYSSRLRWDSPLNPLTELLRRKRAEGARILDLTESNPTAAGFHYPPELLAAFADERNLEYHPSPAGSEAARRAVAARYQGRIGPERILLTSSTSEAYSWVFKLLADPGDEVLAPRPSYPLFEFLAHLESVQPVQYPLAYHGRWSIDFPALEAAITPRSRAVVVVSPNNPTGSFLKEPEFRRLAGLGLPIISDEVFADYTFRRALSGAGPCRAVSGAGPCPATSDAEPVSTLAGRDEAASFSLSGLSKICGLPQMKLGWIIVNGPEAERRQAIDRLELIADTYLSAATPVQNALPRLLGAGIGAQIQTRVRENLAVLRAAIGPDSPCEALDVEGGWYATLRVPRVRSEEEWTLELLDRDLVLVQPGFFYDFEREAFLVVSLLPPPALFAVGAGRLVARIEQVAGKL